MPSIWGLSWAWCLLPLLFIGLMAFACMFMRRRPGCSCMDTSCRRPPEARES